MISILFFFLATLAGSNEHEFDLSRGPVEITEDEGSDKLNILHVGNDLYSADDTFKITGQTTENYVKITVTSRTKQINLHLEQLAITLTSQKAISVTGDCPVHIAVTGTVTISTDSMNAIDVSNPKDTLFTGTGTEPTLVIGSTGDGALIQGTGKFSFSKLSIKSNVKSRKGILVVSASFTSCKLDISTTNEAIGGEDSIFLSFDDSSINIGSESRVGIGKYSPNIRVATALTITMTRCSTNISVFGNGVGIGGNDLPGELNIDSCNITSEVREATSGTFTTSIGGLKKIFINHSNIHSFSNEGAAIGGSCLPANEGLEIFIDNSNIYAETTSTSNSAIGFNRASTDNTQMKCININNSIIVAKSHKGTTIGGNNLVSWSGDIVISNSEINATSTGNEHYVIGLVSSRNINIDNCRILADGKCGGIGGDFNKLSVTRSVINVSSRDKPAIGVQKGNYAKTTISINASQINALSDDAPAIGVWTGSTLKDIIIENSEVYAFCGYYSPNKATYAAAIGGTLTGYLYGVIHINKSNVTAISGYNSCGAGIGGGSGGRVVDIVIEDSNVYAHSSLISNINKSCSGGAGIGYGGSNSEMSARYYYLNKGNFTIKNSNVTAYGGSIADSEDTYTTISAGSGIGHGGINSDLKDSEKLYSTDIYIENSNVYSYGGNSTSAQGPGSAFFGSPNEYSSPTPFNLGSLKISNSYVYGLGGHSSLSTGERSVAGYYFKPKEYNMAGEITVEDSVFVLETQDDSKNSSSVAIRDVTLNQGSQVVFHSTQDNTIICTNKYLYVPFVTLKNLQGSDLNELSIQNSKKSFSFNIKKSDKTISFSVPEQGKYNITGKTAKDSVVITKPNGDNFDFSNGETVLEYPNDFIITIVSSPAYSSNQQNPDTQTQTDQHTEPKVTATVAQISSAETLTEQPNTIVQPSKQQSIFNSIPPEDQSIKEAKKKRTIAISLGVCIPAIFIVVVVLVVYFVIKNKNHLSYHISQINDE